MSFNMLLGGDFAQLSAFTMATWTNECAVGINQDALGKGAVRIDSNGSVRQAQGPAAVRVGGSSGAGGHKLMAVDECGVDRITQSDQKWVCRSPHPSWNFDPTPRPNSLS